jgi:hypothetical protein
MILFNIIFPVWYGTHYGAMLFSSLNGKRTLFLVLVLHRDNSVCFSVADRRLRNLERLSFAQGQIKRIG